MKKRSEATRTLRAGCSKANKQTQTQTNKHTNKYTNRQGNYNTLRSLARSLNTRLHQYNAYSNYICVFIVFHLHQHHVIM